MKDPDSKTAVVVDDVTFGYSKGDVIVQKASFSIQEGEFIGVIGPNGGGKTTLLKLIAGFLKPWKGDIFIFGKAPTIYPNGIAYVPQTLRLDKQFPITVLELVLGGKLTSLPWWGKFSQEDKQEAMKALELVHLTKYANEPFGSLSGGQAQRALIARALIQKPKILLLDEPTASVDAQAEADILDILKELSNRLTIIMVSHNVAAIIHKVKRVLCVQHVVDIIEPSELCEHFALGLYHYPLIQTTETHLKLLHKH